MSEALKAVHHLEREVQGLESLIQELEVQNSKLHQDIQELEQENNHISTYYEDGDILAEQIHLLYYDICERVDKHESIGLDLLNGFFKKAIDKTV